MAEPNRLAARRGIAWWGAGWRLFRQSPAVWIGITVVAFISEVLLVLTPVVSIAAFILLPILIGGAMVGARELDLGRDLSVAHLFAGFVSQRRALAVLGALYCAATLLIDMLVLVGFTQGKGLLSLLSANAAIGAIGWTEVVLLFVIFTIVVLSIALLVVISLASALVILQQLRPLRALELSFRGCLRNITPMLLYGLLGLLLAVAASIPWLLGWLILGPVVCATLYSSYTDIFLQHE